MAPILRRNKSRKLISKRKPTLGTDLRSSSPGFTEILGNSEKMNVEIIMNWMQQYGEPTRNALVGRWSFLEK